jgi:endonuclease/exonuclease/phosphatase family metal-dependent hydrolase
MWGAMTGRIPSTEWLSRRLSRGVRLAAATAFLLVAAAEARGDDSSPCAPIPVDSRNATSGAVGNGPLTVASLNMAAEGRVTDILAAWKDARSVGGADVLLLQEVRQSNGDRETLTAALSRELGLSFAYAAADRLDDGKTQGLAILSRYPLTQVSVLPLKYFRLRFRSRCRIALTAMVETAAGPIRLVNVHLDSRINSGNRLTQLTPVLEDAKRFEGPQVIGGDLNTMNVLWLRTMWPFPQLQRQASAILDAFAAIGFRTPLTDTPPTLRFLGLPFRLDWLFLKGLKPLRWGVEGVEFSDHRAVWVQLDVKGDAAALDVSRRVDDGVHVP